MSDKIRKLRGGKEGMIAVHWAGEVTEVCAWSRTCTSWT
jgi:hypothetical protein